MKKKYRGVIMVIACWIIEHNGIPWCIPWSMVSWGCGRLRISHSTCQGKPGVSLGSAWAAEAPGTFHRKNGHVNAMSMGEKLETWWWIMGKLGFTWFYSLKHQSIGFGPVSKWWVKNALWFTTDTWWTFSFSQFWRWTAQISIDSWRKGLWGIGLTLCLIPFDRRIENPKPLEKSTRLFFAWWFQLFFTHIVNFSTTEIEHLMIFSPMTFQFLMGLAQPPGALCLGRHWCGGAKNPGWWFWLSNMTIEHHP